MASTTKSTSNENNSNKKKPVNFLKREKNKPKDTLSEEDLVAKQKILPEDVLKLKQSTKDYLCQPTDNSYGIEFTRFKIRNMDTEETLFEISKPSPEEMATLLADQNTTLDPNAGRFVRYNFNPEFLRLKTIGATVEFDVGSKPVKKFRMIERHYFREKLLKSFDFDFGFCIPNSHNTCEHIYEFPTLSAEMMNEMIKHPFETKSDSFYFVDGELVMHNKADYAYNQGVTE